MAEPIGPEAYLAIATSMQNVLNNYRDKNRVEQNKKLAIISAESSKSSLTLPADELLSYSGLKIGNDGYVQWALDSPAHPRNWSRERKAYDVGLIFFLEFFMSAISAAGTPTSFYALGNLGHRREVGLVGFTTMYLLGQALGALVLSPYTDKFGRRTLYIASAFLYSVFCLPVAATSNIAGVFVGRLITGVISAVPAIITRASIEELFGAERRMFAFFSWALKTNLGLVIGPVYASYVAVSLNWRWVFYLATIIVAVTGILMYFIRESHTTQLLERKVAAIQSHRADVILRTAPTTPRPSIIKPVILFFTEPIVFLSALTNAFSTALLYLFAVAFPLIYTHYVWNRQKTSLIFLFIALGLFLSPLTRLHDRHAARTCRLANRRPTPEKGLFGLAIGVPVLAVSLWWFAWTIPGAHVQNITWPASAVSLILLGYAVNEHSTVLPRYILESSSTDASSAFAALLCTRALLSAVFPLFTQQLFDHLGNNTAGSILAAIATLSCLVPAILITFGPKLRGSSGSVAESAAGDDEKAAAAAAEKAKTKKTVRWGDETDSGTDGSEETKSENATESASTMGSEISRTETKSEADDSDIISRAETTDIARRDFASLGIEMGNQNGVVRASEISRLETKESESAEVVARVEEKTEKEEKEEKKEETKEKKEKKKEKEKKEKKKEKTRDDDKDKDKDEDKDKGAVGFLGMDIERLAIIPYF
ncbi:MAG: hypothetical protein ASARMPREDX12_008823 [Alectoria sarmentosa]|nr:MAG: hypothetical protein ASARMPREDX12_008823 [Alectoria sarmentosa]